jgi:lipopolysaccharide export LptBFGC system permease protein LptF
VVFIRYFFRNYATYFLTVTAFFALLFSSIEFLEKTARAKSIGIKTISHFVALNSIPAAFDLMPLGSWLATGLLLREFFANEEWDSLFLLNIGLKRIAAIFLATGFVVSALCAITYESFGLTLSEKRSQFKAINFKNAPDQKVLNKWFMLDDNVLCFVEFLDMKTGQGSNFMLIEADTNSQLGRIKKCNDFVINSDGKTVTMFRPKSLLDNGKGVESVSAEVFSSPSFFWHLKSSQITVPRLSNMLTMLFAGRKILGSSTKIELWNLILKRLLFYLQIALFPLITMAFLMVGFHTKIHWGVFILLPYPILTVSSDIADFFVSKGGSLAMLAVPYILILAIILLFSFNKRRLGLVLQS